MQTTHLQVGDMSALCENRAELCCFFKFVLTKYLPSCTTTGMTIDIKWNILVFGQLLSLQGYYNYSTLVFIYI